MHAAPARLARLARLVRLALPLALALATLCLLPALGAGFYGDDYILLDTLEGSPPCMCEPGDLYRYSDGDPAHVAELVRRGTFPWWTHPEFKVALFRPLTSVTMRLDHLAWGVRPFGYHLQSLLWFLALVAATGALFRRLAPGLLGALALAIFAVDESHWLTVGWMSNRHSLVSAVAGVLALLAHLRWREDGWRPGRYLSLAALALGLAGGESGLQTLGYLAGYELAGASGRPGRRALALAPAAVGCALYLAIYKASGYGAYASGAYADPAAEPARFLLRAAEIAPAMLAELVGGTEVFYNLHRPTAPARLVITFAVLAAFAWLLRRALAAAPAPERRAVRWVVLGALLALLPPIASQRDPYGTSRSTLFASIGSALAIAAVLAYGRSLLAQRPSHPAPRRALVVALCAAFALGNLLLEPAALALTLRQFAAGGAGMRAAAGEAAAHERGGAQIVLLTQAQYLTGYGPLMTAALERRAPAPWWNMSWSAHPQELRRTGPDTLELRVLDGALFEHDFEWFYRARGHVVRAGASFSNRRMNVSVLEANAAGPTRVEFRFDRPPDDPSLHFMAWQNGALRRVEVPALGETLRLPGQAP